MKAKFLKSPILHFSLLAVLTGGMVSCGNNNGARTNDDTKEVAEDKNDAKFDSAKVEKDAQFLVNAAEINLEEIKLGQLAQQRGMSADIKSLGQMMVEGHTKALSDLKSLAQSKTISVPDSATKDATDAYDKLQKEKGKDFDRKYCDMMVDGHKNAIDKFEKAASDANDPQIKQWASSMLPDLRKHLDQAMTCQTKLGKK
jgi:putative membrane protein